MGAAYSQFVENCLTHDEFAEYLAGMVYMWEKNVLPWHFEELWESGNLFAVAGWMDGQKYLRKDWDNFLLTI
jgi:hypothetical protein